MRLAVLALVCAALAAACTPMQWVKPDASAEQAAFDEQQCRQAAWREATSRSYWYYQRASPIIGPGFVVWPSGAMVDPYGHQMLEEGWLTQFCMESRGYQLAPAPKQ